MYTWQINSLSLSLSAVRSPAGSGAEPRPKSNLVHFSFKIWHPVATVLTILPKLYQPCREIATKIEKTFFLSVAVGLFLEWAQCCSINIAPTLVAPCQHLWVYCSPRNAQVHTAKQLRTLCVRHQAGTNQQISNVGTKMVILPAVIATTARAWLLLLSAG